MTETTRRKFEIFCDFIFLFSVYFLINMYKNIAFSYIYLLRCSSIYIFLCLNCLFVVSCLMTFASVHGRFVMYQ